MKTKEDFTNPFRQGDLLYTDRPPRDDSKQRSKIKRNFYVQDPRITHYKVEKVVSDWVTLAVLDHYEIPIRSIRRKVEITGSGASLWISVRIEGSGTGTLWALPLKKESITKDEVPTIIELKSDSRGEYLNKYIDKLMCRGDSYITALLKCKSMLTPEELKRRGLVLGKSIKVL